MPMLDPVGDDTTSQTAKEIFEKLHAKLQMVPNIFRTMAHAPEVLEATLGFNGSFQRGLDPKLRELAYLKTSLLNECHY